MSNLNKNLQLIIIALEIKTVWPVNQLSALSAPHYDWDSLFFAMSRAERNLSLTLCAVNSICCSSLVFFFSRRSKAENERKQNSNEIFSLSLVELGRIIYFPARRSMKKIARSTERRARISQPTGVSSIREGIPLEVNPKRIIF